MGYHASVTLRNARRLLPQHRKRVFITAVRKDWTTRKTPLTIPPTTLLPKHLQDPTISDRAVRNDHNIADHEMTQELLPEEDVQRAYLRDDDRLPWRKYKRLISGSDAAPTIMRSYGTAHEHTSYTSLHGWLWAPTREHPTQRWAHPKELLALQGFPRTYKPHDLIRAGWAMVGNAVPPPLAIIEIHTALANYQTPQAVQPLHAMLLAYMQTTTTGRTCHQGQSK